MNKWEKIPMKVREKIVQNSTENTRNALRACSSENKELIEATCVNSLYSLTIGNNRLKESEWSIEAVKWHFEFSCLDVVQNFDNFDEFQKTLTTILASFQCIKELKINQLSSNIPLKLLSGELQQRILVESLEIFEQTEDYVKSVLSQIEPIYLRKICIWDDWGNSSIYSIPQIVFAEKVEVLTSCSIQENQLLKLQAKFIKMTKIDCALEKYIEKCVVEATENVSDFTFYLYNGPTLKSLYSSSSPYRKTMLETADPRIKLELTFTKRNIKGRVRFDYKVGSKLWPYTCSMLRIIKCLTISYDAKNSCWKIEVISKNNPYLHHKYRKFGNLQEKLTEILDNADYIKTIYIKMEGSPKQIQWKTREKQLTVGEICVFEVNLEGNVCDLLQQVEPDHLKHLSIFSNAELNAIFDLPQALQTRWLYVKNSFPNDDQLLKMNAHVFQCVNKTVQNTVTTASGINKLLKKFVATIEKEHYDFLMCNLPQKEMNEAILFEGLDIVSRVNFPRRLHYIEYDRITIDSPHPDYVIRVDLYTPENDVSIERRRGEG